jgi:mannose-6-phosphate isomerase-like protein (cupin superfamily)
MKLSRRDLSLLLPALAAAAEDRRMLTSKALKYEDLPVKLNGQNKGRAVFDGETHPGARVELHMTEPGPGQAPHPPHQHPHEEVLMLRRGLLHATFGGKTTQLTAGSVIYVASNELHGWKTPGPKPAEYFVIALH